MTDIQDRIDAGAETIGQAIGFDPMEPVTVEPVDAPRIEGMGEWPGEGIFFGMPEAEYHSIFACSASVLKDMSVSPMFAWAKSPLNPDREDDDTVAKMLGRAYHVRICEGLAAYERCYAIALDKADYPNALVTVDDIKKAIAEASEEIVSRIPTGVFQPSPTKADPDRQKEVTRAAGKPDWIAQLLEIDPTAEIWDLLNERHEEANAGRILISADADKRIQIAARMIEGDPELSKAFSGGYAEVSLFWRDKATGAPCKARIDYLKMNAFVDLKSFSLKVERPVDRAIDYEIASRKHYIPVVHYSDGIAAVKALVRERGDDAIMGAWDHDALKDHEAVHSFARRWANVSEEPTPLYVFQATGIAPITRGKVLVRGSTFQVTRIAVEMIRKRFVEYCRKMGAEPWLDLAKISNVTDESVPMSAVDFGEMDDA